MDAVRFGPDGVVTVVVQDARTGEVLMVASADREALERTARTGQAWYWSRSRGRLWRKGETSGHIQRVREIRVDCDGDAVLFVVDQTGPACHTGRRTCFHRALGGEDLTAPARPDVLDEVFAVVQERAASLPEGSYTAALLRGGMPAVAAKVREEADELARAGGQEDAGRVAEEAADLFYHALVLLAARGVSLDDVRAVLARRRHAR
ncbi:MAG: bifunctional phosphoribosyl-AMP cyclohydrolase/phosphoribosyl-ATP diphosphatase HisIE [Armatimonadota bacterium]|nr:bifunctional phosphoribosyl-AMP cyclohydrolase/phosphoribosyl-ATP diphosphatase HisIE [Armatimonadota bacterium]MDR7437147.1 bifunctional phosphoribosyl-AMP cyclohydrolase/phosphoribosyl-ATP diphosphatase HisIE [Armatimonadota bacterium]MDR7471899.1 bifunctional phosphoribosyl-AMP cyclohydrolase/phosphoribosyl-ATP diphosphatase HisIE [Armatimonadota bacterium]MDR7507879.1 bifunctional phosphoribosyl-AMP cyclohydrolase/phosphoribosyl-ATP diphosphatase HisIE [Armatimonadota bacterium]MDR751022